MDIEFYTPAVKVFKSVSYFRQGNEWRPLEDLDDNQFRIIYEQLRNNKFAALALKRLQDRGITAHREKLRRFVRCNWGVLDNTPDIADDGTLNFERVECECRSTCKDRGIICIIK